MILLFSALSLCVWVIANFTIICIRADPRQPILIDGDLLIGVLISVHDQQENGTTSNDCSYFDELQAVEAILYTLDEINAEQIIPNTKLGALILPDCGRNDQDVFQLLMKFIQGKNQPPNSFPSGWHERLKPVVGLIVMLDNPSVPNITYSLKQVKIPQLTISSQDVSLDDGANTRPLFFRTVLSLKWKFRAMADIMSRFKWNYIGVVYDSSSRSSRLSVAALEEELASLDICIGVKETFPNSSQIDAYNSLMIHLYSKPIARVIIVFASEDKFRHLLLASQRLLLSDRLIFFGAGDWTSNVLDGMSRNTVPASIISLESPLPRSKLRGFNFYFDNLKISTNARNPWFREKLDCNSSQQQKHPNDDLDPSNLVPYLSSETRINGLHFISDTTLVLAYALRDFFKEKCNDSNVNYTDCILSGHNQDHFVTTESSTRHNHCNDFYKKFFSSFIRCITFERHVEGDRSVFNFWNETNGFLPKYDIMHFRPVSDEVGKLNSSSTFSKNIPFQHWVHAGTWRAVSKSSTQLSLNYASFKFPNMPEGQIPHAQCSDECKHNEIRIIPTGGKCCWVCMKSSLTAK